MSEQIFVNEAATAAVSKFRNTSSGIGLLQAHCDFLAVVSEFQESSWVDKVIDRVEAAYEANLMRVNKV